MTRLQEIAAEVEIHDRASERLCNALANTDDPGPREAEIERAIDDLTLIVKHSEVAEVVQRAIKDLKRAYAALGREP